MDMKLELVPIPVSDIDRIKAFMLNRWFMLTMMAQQGNGMQLYN